MSGALPFSECNERLPFVAIQRPTEANAILLRKKRVEKLSTLDFIPSRNRAMLQHKPLAPQ